MGMKRIILILILVAPVLRAQSVVDFSETATRTIDGVVHIKCRISRLTPMYQSFFGMLFDQGMRRQEYEAYGSGVIITEDGYIVTNNHVVNDAASISVTLNDKRVLPATLVGTDPATDLAVIKIEASGLVSIPFGNSDAVRVGQPCLAIGNPFNLTSTVTAGIISAKARNMDIIQNTSQESTIESFLQTDAAVNSGNSGGALVNAAGELIGINTAIASGNGYYTGYSFAIPSNIARKVSTDLMRYGVVQRGYLGVQVSEQGQQVVIGRLSADCAADRAGLQVGDILLAINGVEIHSYAEMMEEVGYFYPGDEVAVTYQRNGSQHTQKLTLLNSKGTTDVLPRR